MSPYAPRSDVERVINLAVDRYYSFEETYLTPIYLKISDFFLSFLEAISDAFVAPQDLNLVKRLERAKIADLAWKCPDVYAVFVDNVSHLSKDSEKYKKAYADLLAESKTNKKGHSENLTDNDRSSK